MSERINILFVCTGNTCRSCMAEDIFKRKLQEKGLEGKFEVGSAGIATQDGRGASEEAKMVVKEHGGDLSSYKSKQLTPDMIERSDYIFTMTSTHKKNILQMNPQVGKKVYVIKEFINCDLEKNKEALIYDIPDPIGGTKEDYENIYRELDHYIDKILGKL